MKNLLNVILLGNTIFTLSIADNPNVVVFIYPVAIYVIFGFLRIHHRDITKYLTSSKY